MVLDINLRVDTVVSGIWTRYVRAAQVFRRTGRKTLRKGQL